MSIRKIIEGLEKSSLSADNKKGSYTKDEYKDIRELENKLSVDRGTLYPVSDDMYGNTGVVIVTTAAMQDNQKYVIFKDNDQMYDAAVYYTTKLVKSSSFDELGGTDEPRGDISDLDKKVQDHINSFGVETCIAVYTESEIKLSSGSRAFEII